MLKLTFLSALTIVLSGCTAVNVAYQYDDMPYVSWANPDDGITYKVQDKPAINGMLIGANAAETAGMGATMGISARPASEFQAAALTYLSTTGRHCTIVSFTELVVRLYEAKYSCS